MLRLWPPEMVERSVPLTVLLAPLLLLVLVTLVLSLGEGFGGGFVAVVDGVGVELRL